MALTSRQIFQKYLLLPKSFKLQKIWNCYFVQKNLPLETFSGVACFCGGGEMKGHTLSDLRTLWDPMGISVGSHQTLGAGSGSRRTSAQLSKTGSILAGCATLVDVFWSLGKIISVSLLGPQQLKPQLVVAVNCCTYKGKVGLRGSKTTTTNLGSR